MSPNTPLEPVRTVEGSDLGAVSAGDGPAPGSRANALAVAAAPGATKHVWAGLQPASGVPAWVF